VEKVGEQAVNTASRAKILLIEDESKTAHAVLNGLKEKAFRRIHFENLPGQTIL